MITQVFTLIFVRGPGDQVLLGYKTRGFGAGLWNGFGGKVEDGESVLDGAHRELLEEAHLRDAHMQYIGIVRYHMLAEDTLHIVHIFTAKAIPGDERPSEEMCPLQWYSCNDLPYRQMHRDAPFWIPNVFQEPPKYFKTDITYRNNMITDIDNRYSKDNFLDTAD